MKRLVMGKTTWPEPDATDFGILYARDNETDAQAIERARSHYSPDLECYIVEEA